MMKKTLKFFCIIGTCILLTGCNSDAEIEKLENQIDVLEEKINLLLEQYNITTDDSNTVSNDGEGTTTVDTTEITSTIASYNEEAQSIADSISNLSTPSTRSEAISLFFEWKYTIEDLETKLDRYEDSLKVMYRNNELSYTDYRTFERQLENIEDILDEAEDTLEFITNYDD